MYSVRSSDDPWISFYDVPTLSRIVFRERSPVRDPLARVDCWEYTMNRRNALRSCFALGAAASTSNLAFGRAGQKAASMPIGLPPSEPAVNAHLIVANVEIAGVPALAAILPEGTIDLGALGRHMGIEVPTSCDALAAPPKLTQVRSLLREAQRS